MGSSTSRNRTVRPRGSNTPAGNIEDLWFEVRRLQDQVRAVDALFKPPLELEVDIVAGTEQRIVRLVNNATGGVLVEWGPA